MPSLRRTASRVLHRLPEPYGDRIRRAVHVLEQRLKSGPGAAVTYVVSPHPDDETLRLAGLVTGLRENTPGRLVLVAISDGGSSGRARKMGWSPDFEREFRRAEQAAAWSALTGGTGEIVRIGLPDGAVTAEEVRDALSRLNKRGARFYVAAHEQDYHADHRAVVAGVRLLGPADARFALAPLMPGKGETHRPSAGAADAVSIAVAAYKDFGQLSAPDEFRALAQSGYVSRVTEWSGEKVGPGSVDLDPRGGTETRRRNRRDGEDQAPVFVLGNQKSGSTAIAALLAECIGGTLMSDVLFRNGLRLVDLLGDESALAELAGSHPEAFQATVVKDNDFTFLFPALARAFPQASFVFVVRDPRQNIRSVLNRLKLPGNLASLSDETYADLRKSLPGWYDIVTGSSFSSEGGHYIDVLADRWVRANQVYVGASERMRLVRYEDFDASKRRAIEQLTTDLGFPVHKDISELQDRQFQPRGDRSVTPAAFFGAENLERVERRCAPLMASFGYEPAG